MTLHRDVAAGVHRIESGPVNWYLVEDTDGVTIVDAGLPRSWDQLGWALARIGRRVDDLRALVLTHAHYDHVGFAERARRELGLPVLVHPGDEPLSRHPWRFDHERHPAAYAWRPACARNLASMTAQGALWVKGVERVQPIAAGQELELPGRPRVVATPGHTHGHVALHLPDRDTVIAGDAIVTVDPYTGKRGPRLVARAATADVARNLDSLEAIAATGARTVLTGHGEPFTEGAAAAAERARAAGSA
jgi:glyoxylase-like metal-dependent hydrolase (beta-lactamase superfamily II)